MILGHMIEVALEQIFTPELVASSPSQVEGLRQSLVEYVTGCCDHVQQGQGRGARALLFHSAQAASAGLLVLCERRRRAAARSDLQKHEGRWPQLGGQKG